MRLGSVFPHGRHTSSQQAPTSRTAPSNGAPRVLQVSATQCGWSPPPCRRAGVRRSLAAACDFWDAWPEETCANSASPSFQETVPATVAVEGHLGWASAARHEERPPPARRPPYQLAANTIQAPAALFVQTLRGSFSLLNTSSTRLVSSWCHRAGFRRFSGL